MNRLVSLAAAAAFSALSVAGAAQASSMAAGTMDHSTASRDLGAIETLHGNGFKLVHVDRLGSDTPQYLAYQTASAGENAADVQQAIEANPDLMKNLQNRNVEIGNIVAASKAANGSVTFYLR